MRWLAASVAALIVFALLSQAAGGLAWLVAVSAVAVAVTAAVTVRASRQTRPAALDAAMPPRALRQDQVVRLDELNDQCRALFGRGREALDDLRSSPDDHGNPAPRRDEGTFDRERVEWTLADKLRTITQDRARYEADPATDPGPAAWHALEVAQEQAEAMVRALDETVPQSTATNLTFRRYLGTERARRSGDQGISAAAAISAEADSVIEHIRAYREGLAERTRRSRRRELQTACGTSRRR
jgi:hypothetical protein